MWKSLLGTLPHSNIPSRRRDVPKKSTRVYLVWSPEAERLARSAIQLPFHLGNRLVADCTEIRPLGEILSDQPVDVLVGSTFPRMIGMREIDVDSKSATNLLVPACLSEGRANSRPLSDVIVNIRGRYPRVISATASSTSSAMARSTRRISVRRLFRSTSVTNAP